MKQPVTEYRYNPLNKNQTFWLANECTPEGFLGRYPEGTFDNFFKMPEVQSALNENDFEKLFEIWDKETDYVVDCLVQMLWLAGIHFENYIDFDTVFGYMDTDATSGLEIKGVDY